MRDHKLVLAIDFDGVLHDSFNREPGYRMGKPIPHAVTAMRFLSEQGHQLIVHTARAKDVVLGDEGGRRHVEEWLDYFGIPYDQVTAIKPNADVFLDDRALRFVNWHHALMAIEEEAK